MDDMAQYQANKLKQLIEQTIRKALSEQEDGGGYQTYDGMSFYDDSPMGGGGGEGGSQTVAGAFLDPLKDIGKTGLWALKTLTTKLTHLIPAIIGSWFAGMIPYLSGDNGTASGDVFNTFREHELDALEKLDSKYEEVLKRNMEALRSNDVWGLAFLLNPQALIAEKLVEKAPKVAYTLLDALSGGLVSAGINKIGHALHEDMGDAELKEKLAQLLQDKNFVSKLNSSAGVRASHQAAADILVGRAAQVLSAPNIQTIAAITGKDMSNAMFDKAGIPPQQRTEAVPGLLKLLKDNFKVEYLAGLRHLSQTNPAASQVINQAISKINSM